MNRFASSGGDIAYTDQGEGKAALLVHGFPTSSYMWRELSSLLATRYRTITVDLLGYGESAKPADADLSITAQARYLGELLDSLGVEGDLAAIGHDIGGGIAQLLAFEGRATALVLIDSISLDSWPIEGVKMIQASDPEDATAEFAEGLVRVAIELGIGKPEQLTDGLVAAYTAPWTAEGGPQALVRAARGIDGEGLIGSEPKLEALGDSVLVLWGEDDPYQEAHLAERLSDLIPGATVALLPGCSHFLLEDAPRTVVPLIYEWLRVRYLREPHHHAGQTSAPVEVTFERPEPPSEDSYFE